MRKRKGVADRCGQQPPGGKAGTLCVPIVRKQGSPVRDPCDLLRYAALRLRSARSTARLTAGRAKTSVVSASRVALDAEK